MGLVSAWNPFIIYDESTGHALPYRILRIKSLVSALYLKKNLPSRGKSEKIFKIQI
jgi:hypothetical protein